MRNFDVKQQYEAVKKSAIDAVKNIFPVDGKLRVLRLEKAWVDDTLDSTDYTSQAKAKEKEQTWGASVYADLSLVEKTTGKVVDHAPKVRLFTLPKITDRFSYIVNGNEYQVHNQLRLKPGIYTLRKQNGELKTQFNLGVGKNFDLAFKESNGVFYLQKIGGGSASIPLYPVLSYLGVSPSLIASTWGSQIEAANRNTDPKVVQKAAASFGIKKGTLKEYLARTRLSPETTKLVLGVSFERVDGPALLAASKHLLDVHLGKKDPVDRDSLAFKELHGVEDFVQLRLEKNKDSLLHKIRRSIDNPNREKISQIVNPASFNSVVETFFTQDDKSATPEQTNPLEMISGAYKATIMGSGGIKSRHAVTPEMRNVHHSHYGLLDPAHTPESDKVGANLTMAVGAIKDGKSLKMVVIGKDGKPATLSAEEAYGKYIAFPDQKGDTVKAMHQGNIVEIPKEKVDFKTPHPGSIFSMSSNLIPYLPSNQGNRATMASKMLEQAIGLKHREAPLVQVGLGDGTSMEEQIGRTVAKMAPEDGTVKQVTPDHIILSTASGDKKINLYNNFSLNRKSFMHHDPVVKKGDRVKKGQLLAESNFTRGGTLALGTNLRTAYLPYKGYNFEDGIVITESAAEKLTSEHIYKKSYDIDDTSIVKLSAFTSFYPNTIKYGSARKLDPDGVIKKGERVEQGDVVIAALRKRSASATIRVISKALSERPKDDSVYWNQEDPGTVLDVQKTPKKITVLIKTEEKAKIGDKLSGRMGNKGIITKILPDNEAPHSADGKPVDILLNPHGVISRINIGQIYESAAAKAATKAGEPHRVRNFSGENYLESTKDFISKHGVEDKEELFDPETGKSLGRVHVGNPHILKLFKQSTANYSARQGGPGTAYDINKQPIKAGGDEGSKALDVLTFYSMLSHGARANLREMASVKSTQNDEYWKALKSGQLLPPPQSPFAYDKFMSYLKAAGVDVKKEGNSLALEPLTDKQVLEMSSAAITKPLLFRAKDMQPIPGGFFDPARLGGFKGEKWGHIELKEPIVNPVFESAVKKITGLGNKLDGITSGKTYVDETGKLNTEKKGLTGGAGVERLLKAINVDEQIKTLTKKALTAKSDQLDDLNKRIRYLTALKESGLRPEEAYIRRHIPVLPPVMRPIYPLPNGDIQTSDTNLLYQNAGIMNYVMNLPVMNLLGDEDKADVRKDLYESAKGISGVTSLNIKGRVRDGFIGQIKGGTGGQPKEGFFISKLLSKKQDYVGRGTIIPEPSLGVDQMAMPEEMAWKLFEPFIVRELSKFGKTPISAKKEIQQKTALAKKALEIVMRDRHVLLNRAPSLHKFSIMAFKPTITQGKAVKIPPLVTKAYNADFDGDQQSGLVFAHLSKEAQNEVSRKLGISFLEERKMTARFNVNVPALAGGDVFVFNLEDFPHADLVRTKDGLNGRIDFHSMIPGVKVLAYDEKSGAVEWKEVSNWSRHHDREIEIVNLRSGRQIVTDNDPRAVYGIARGSLRCERFTPKDAAEKGVFVPRVVSLEGLGGDIREYRVDKSDGRKYRSKEILSLDASFGYVIGAVAGDGWCSAERSVCLAGISEAVVSKFEQCLKPIFASGTPSRYTHVSNESYGHSIKHTFTSKDLCLLISPMVGSGADKKHLPPFFMSACREFREGLFAGLMDTDGSISISNGKSKPQLMSNFQSNSLRLAQEVQLLAMSLGIRGRITTAKTPAGKPCWMLSFSNLDIKSWGGEGMVHEDKIRKLSSIDIDTGSTVAAKNDIVPISKSLASHLLQEIGAPRNASQEHKSLYQVIHKATGCGSMSRASARAVVQYLSADKVLSHSDAKQWLSIIENDSVTWDPVESYEVTGMRETGYDLTVPGHETFMNVDGVVLSNTMTVHVPISDEANKEAEKMLPSRNLFQPGSGRLMMAPSQESQIGLFYLSKTPQGRDRINKLLPPKFQIKGVLNKKETVTLLQSMSKEMPPANFGKALAEIKAEGDKHAFERGFTLGLEDIFVPTRERDAVGKKIQELASKAKTQKDLEAINAEGTHLINSILDKHLEGKENPLYDMVTSGARGEKGQLRQILAAPLFVQDTRGGIVPRALTKSYAEGLDVADYWTSMYGARRGIMDRSIQTSLPGAFSKDIMATTLDNVVSAVDCGTKEGIIHKVDDPDCLDRLLAGDQGGMPHNTVVTSTVISTLRKKGVEKVNVRSPLRCRQPRGTCARCYGLDEHGQLPEVGDNIGAKAGQTMAEPLVQLVMNTKHTGGAAGTGASVSGYQRINQLLQLPKTLVSADPLSPVDGKVTKIQPGIAGGFDVWVGDKKVHVPQGNKLTVQVGSKVLAGDVLSDGVVRPQDLVKYKGMKAAQDYITTELKNSYKAQGQTLHRKVFETVVRSLGNTTQVLNNPKDSGHLPGDIIPYTVAEAHNQNLVVTKPVDEAVGFKTAEKILSFPKGHEITAKDLVTLKGLGIKEVKVEKDPIVHAPFLKGMSNIPLLKKNWMAALGYRQLEKNIVEGASQRWTTDLSDYHPIPAFAKGTEFGKGKEGKY